MKLFLNLVFAALLAGVAGCVTVSDDAAQGSVAGETCHVCRYNNDLACVCVKVTEKTPRSEFEGRTYYFCSEDCRATFARNPKKYLPKAAHQ